MDSRWAENLPGVLDKALDARNIAITPIFQSHMQRQMRQTAPLSANPPRWTSNAVDTAAGMRIRRGG